jgi:hypothetical protein
MKNKKLALLMLCSITLVSMPFSGAENPPPKYPLCVAAQSVPPAGTPASNGSCSPEGLVCVELVGVGCAQGASFPKPKDASCDGDKKSESPCATIYKEITQGKSQQGCSGLGQPFLGTCTCEHTGVEDNVSRNGGFHTVSYKVCK